MYSIAIENIGHRSGFISAILTCKQLVETLDRCRFQFKHLPSIFRICLISSIYFVCILTPLGIQIKANMSDFDVDLNATTKTAFGEKNLFSCLFNVFIDTLLAFQEHTHWSEMKRLSSAEKIKGP